MRKLIVMLVLLFPMMAVAQQKSETVEVIMLKLVERSAKSSDGSYTMPSKIDGMMYISNEYILLSDGGKNQRFKIVGASSETSPERSIVSMSTIIDGTDKMVIVEFRREGSNVDIYFIYGGGKSVHYKVDIHGSGNKTQNSGEKIRYNKTKKLSLI
ncbi:MAG TPA: hypothetical protein VFU05_18285 [Cyclobacteriaceae bacterium]|nr:hypothetical protein [Cyclobacteriaceae bacterium]